MDIDKTFLKGVHLFNNADYNNAHICWEEIRQKGNKSKKIEIKGFIQLTGSFINELLGKKSSALYLAKKSFESINKSKELKLKIKMKNLVELLEKRIVYLKNNKHTKKFIIILL